MLTVTAHGATIPLLGLGTWQLRGETCVAMVREAIAIGYRHLDTAQAYENEAEVGEGLRASGLPRDEVWVTTKIWFDRFRDGDLQRSAEESVRRLGFEPDLLLLHWPNPQVPLEETLGALADARRRGLSRHVGVSNFTTALIREAVRLSSEPIVNNQVEYHPFVDQRPLLEECRSLGISVTAYSPIGKGKVADHPVIREIAQAHRKTPAQIALRWHLQQNVIAIPRSSRPERLRENFEVFDFALSDDDMARLFEIGRRDGRMVAPAWSPTWD